MNAPDRLRLADQPLECAIESRERLADGFRPLDRLVLSHRSLDGTRRYTGIQREVLRCRSAAVILPYDPVHDSIVLIRQFRIGAAMMTPNAAALELPAGLIDEGEETALTAERELHEETGLAALAIAPIFDLLSSPGLCDEVLHFFLAIVDSDLIPPSAGLPDEDEDIIPVAAPATALIEALDEGRLMNGPLVTALNWFDRKGRPMARVLADSIPGDETP